ncbi:MAG TPA: SDR family NAD(P)-dependent oxidoreductase [Anaeromyxobacter sp.]
MVGASEGLGAAFAAALAEAGLDLLLVARRPAPLDALAHELRRAHGVAVRALAADAGAPGGAEAILRAAGALDVGLGVLSAAASVQGPFLALAPEVLERTLDTNCRAVTVLAHGLLGRLAPRGRGGLVLLTSMAGLQGTAQVALYAATKAYVRVLAEGLWAELRPRGVDVLACCAGRVRTPTYEASAPGDPGRLAPAPMEPGAVARAALAALGRGPVVIPGRANRLAAFLTSRLLPRRTAVSLVSRSTRAMYPGPAPAGSRRSAPPGGRGG